MKDKMLKSVPVFHMKLIGMFVVHTPV